MGISYNTSIVRDGLVFYYDMNNTQKSWKGAPTTNLVQDPLTMPTSTWTARENVTITYNEVDPLGFKNAVKITPNSTTDNYFGSRVDTLGVGTYSTSVWAKASKSISISFFTGSGGSTGQFIQHTTTLNESWQYITYTGTTTVNPTQHTFHVGGWNSWTDNTVNVWIAYPQVELNSFVTPFVNGSRTNTQAILDLSGQNTITASDLTYNVDGSFSFNGVGNYLSLSDSINTRFTHNFPWSFQIVYKVNSFVNTFPGLIIKGSASSSGVILYYINSGSLFWKHNNTQTVALTHSIGETVCCCITYDGTTVKSYKNGSYIASHGAMTSTDTSSSFQLGRADQFGNQYIYSASKYNKELSAVEVKQNFEALRDRYGI